MKTPVCEGMILVSSKLFFKDQQLVTELEFTGNLFSSFVDTWSHVMNVNDHTKQIQYFTQNKELMIYCSVQHMSTPAVAFITNIAPFLYLWQIFYTKSLFFFLVFFWLVAVQGIVELSDVKLFFRTEINSCMGRLQCLCVGIRLSWAGLGQTGGPHQCTSSSGVLDGYLLQ